MRYLPIATAISLTFLTACSSDRSEPTIPPTPSNQAPVITLESSITADEKSELLITATATDADGSIANYAWSDSSAEGDVTLVNADATAVTVTLPEVMQDTIRTLTLTVTDDDGDTTSATVDIDVTQLTIPLTITGMVTDSPIANANIQVHIEGMADPIETTADANGEYSVDLTLDDSQAEAFVSIQANGVGEQANAGLISLLGSVNKLTTLAGDDAALTTDEYFAAQITNYTTAQYGLMTQLSDTAITTDEGFSQALAKLDYTQLLQLAAAIKVAIDKSASDDTLTLPAGIETTLDMASNKATANDYIDQVEDTPAYMAAVKEIFADPNIVDTKSEWVIPERYYLLPENGMWSNGVFEFTSDNTGFFTKTPYTWQLSNGVLSTLMDASSFSQSVRTVNIGGSAVQVDIEFGIESIVSKRVAATHNVDTLFVTRTDVVRYPNGELPDDTTIYQYIQLAYKDLPFVDIELTAPTDAYLSMEPILDENDGLVIVDKYKLNADGTGTGLFNDNTVEWQLTDGILTLFNMSDKPAGLSARYQQLQASGVYNFYLYEEMQNDEVTFAIMFKGHITSVAAQWDTQTIPGIYSMVDGTSINPEFKIWVEFRADGEVDYFKQRSRLGSDFAIEAHLGFWSITDEGSLQILTGVDNQTFEFSQTCRDYQATGCTRGLFFSFSPVFATENGMAAILKQERYDTSFYTVSTVMSKVNAHLESVSDLLSEQSKVSFDENTLISQSLSVFDAQGEFVTTLHIESENTVADQTGATGSWLVNANGALEIDISTHSFIITPDVYDEDTATYQVTWQLNTNSTVAATIYVNTEFSINLSSFTAVSTITNSHCPSEKGGWSYSFSATTMTITGSDTWINCQLASSESGTITMADLASDYDIPFNCADFPICKFEDLHKVITGVDEDDRSFTSTYTYDLHTGRMTYTKVVPNDDGNFTEVIFFQ